MAEHLITQPASADAPADMPADMTDSMMRQQFEAPFTLDDLHVFDGASLSHMIASGAHDLTVETLALALHGAHPAIIAHVQRALPTKQRPLFATLLGRLQPEDTVAASRQRLLDNLFWELTYWKTPHLYEALTEGEQLHPGIFQQLAPDLRGAVTLDAGAGAGRATFACLRTGARHVYAVEPSPGLLRILTRKLHEQQPTHCQVTALQGYFDALPMPDASVDVTLSCSAFTSEPEQGGEHGLAELRRVTRPDGKIVIIWPRPEDRDWLTAHGFHYVALPVEREMCVSYRSQFVAHACAARFYAHNQRLRHYLSRATTPEVPYSVLGVNPPCDYCWLRKGR